MAKKSEAKPTAKMPGRKAEVGGRKSEVCHPPSAICRPSYLLDTRVVYCGDNLEQLGPCRTGQLACVDLIYIDPPFNSNRNYDDGQSGSDF